MELTKEAQDEILENVKKQCDKESVELAKELFKLGDDVGIGVIVIGLKLELDATKEEMLMISHTLEYLKQQNSFAYEMFEMAFMSMLGRKAKKSIGEYDFQMPTFSDDELPN